MAGVLTMARVLQEDCSAAPDQRPPRVLLGCSGSVASIKVPLLARLLRNCGAEVVMLPSQQALHFLKLQAEDNTPTQAYECDQPTVSNLLSGLVQVNSDLNSRTDVRCNSMSRVDCSNNRSKPIVKETVPLTQSVNKSNGPLYYYKCSQVYEQNLGNMAGAANLSEGIGQTAGAAAALEVAAETAAGGAPSESPGSKAEHRAIVACEWCSVQALYPDLEIAGNVLEWELWRGRGDCVLHVQLRRWADVLLIAPLSANTLAKVAGGLCDNLLTCVVRAWDMCKPLLFCPAMNTLMYDHPLTARHIALLKELGYVEVEAVTKRLVCGDLGSGAMAELETIVRAVLHSSQGLCWSHLP